MVGSPDGLAPSRREAIIWTIDEQLPSLTHVGNKVKWDNVGKCEIPPPPPPQKKKKKKKKLCSWIA